MWKVNSLEKLNGCVASLKVRRYETTREEGVGSTELTIN